MQKFPWLRCWFTLTLPGKGLPEGLLPPTVALLTDVFSATLIFSLFLPGTLLLQGVLNFDSSFCDCCLITSLISVMVPRFLPICHLLGFYSCCQRGDGTVSLGHLRIWTPDMYVPWTKQGYLGNS